MMRGVVGSNGRYDRQLLLLGDKRDAMLDLADVQRYGTDSYGDAEYVSLYGLGPSDWYAKGVRVLGRTAVECTRDRLADAIGRAVAVVASRHAVRGTGVVVVDPFAGSANTLYWLRRHLGAGRAVGFENDPGVFAMTHRNLELLQLPIEYLQLDYTEGLASLELRADELLVAFVAPPWGHALSAEHGLDLRMTSPPVLDIVGAFRHRFGQRTLFALQTFERLVPGSIDELRTYFDWSQLRTFDLNRHGENHGVFMATLGWTPTFDTTLRT
jgi:hypothetical protein